MASNPLAYLREIIQDALALAGFERTSWSADPMPPAGKYWLRIEGAAASPEYDADAAGVVHVHRRTWVALACVAGEGGSADRLDAVTDDALTQLRYAVEAYEWDRVPRQSFEAFDTSCKPLGAGVVEDQVSALYEEARGLVAIVGWVDYESESD